jgi:alkylation response protein AidB-like acyl-CoA dehydrogenase
MDLTLTEEQQMIVDMTHGILEEHCSIETVRQVEDDPRGYPDALWKQFSESGLTGMLIPEALGGADRASPKPPSSTKSSASFSHQCLIS